MKRTKQLPHVPDHIILEILRSLPGKSLARFKCVCKSWHSFLSQLKYDHKVILCSSSSFRSVDFEASSRNIIKDVRLDFPLEVGGGVCGYTVIGSCNGLLLVIYDEGLVIWNPWTGGHKALSSLFDPLENFDDFGCYFDDRFGFGYDHSTDDYKIVRISRSDDNKYQVEIYSLKTKSCQKRITLPWQIGYIKRRRQPGNFINGALYWPIRYAVGFESISLAVLRFDLSNQEFNVILSPKEFQRREQLGVLGGRLCMFGYNRENHMCMWAMEDNVENQNQNWIKLLSIPLPPLEETEGRFLIPVCFMNNGELLLTTGQRKSYIELIGDIQEFFIYDAEEKTLKEMRGINEFFTVYKTITYTQTLVSPLMY
ncbi:hypothetical protein Dsin_029920 [Dipteronia sinensis]|uniref:F-box domain-containing protein n=1 Tax=Dipteronia sinensis TaxID=43782 RepID=A0AAE0DW05_9ROSI|nr:hypothetical protein Dsin_029920 [Dipteronia sinensis]